MSLKFEEVGPAARQVVKVFQSPADRGASAALYERVCRSVRRIGNLNREAAALRADELETRLNAGIGGFCDRHVDTHISTNNDRRVVGYMMRLPPHAIGGR